MNGLIVQGVVKVVTHINVAKYVLGVLKYFQTLKMHFTVNGERDVVHGLPKLKNALPIVLHLTIKVHLIYFLAMVYTYLNNTL
jgi:hypothetical protein